MQGKDMLFGPEETSRRAIMLKLLLALEGAGLDKVDVNALHRSLGMVGTALKYLAKQPHTPMAFQRVQFDFNTETGRYPELEEFLQELALFGIVKHLGSGANFIMFEPDTKKELTDALSRLCELRNDEKATLEALGTHGEAAYRRIAKDSCCD